MLLYRAARGSILAWRQSAEVSGTGTIAVPTASLTLTAFAPTVGGLTTLVSVPAAALTLTAYAPSIQSTQQEIKPRYQWMMMGRGVGRVGSIVRRAADAGADRTIAIPRAALTLTAFTPTASVGVSYTSAGVLYIPIRMVSALWSASGVDPTTGEVAWLPRANQPMTYLDSRGNTLCDPTWYRAFEYLFERRMGGKLGPTLPAIVQTVTASQTASAAATATVTELQQQTSANAEALYAVRSVAKLNLLDGAEQIPPVEL